MIAFVGLCLILSAVPAAVVACSQPEPEGDDLTARLITSPGTDLAPPAPVAPPAA